MTAKTVAQTLLSKYFCTFGFPRSILSDQGTNFTADVFKEMCEVLGITQHLSPAYSPWQNGSVERANATIVSLLQTIVNKNGTNWNEMLPYAVLAYNSTPSRTTNMSPFELLYGRIPMNPLLPSNQWIKNDDTRQLYEAWQLAAKHDEEYRSKVITNAEVAYAPNAQVLVHHSGLGRHLPHKLALPWLGPFKVKQQQGQTVTIINEHGGENDVHTRWIKLHSNEDIRSERAISESPVQTPTPTPVTIQPTLKTTTTPMAVQQPQEKTMSQRVVTPLARQTRLSARY